MNATMDFTDTQTNSQSKPFPNPLIIHSLKRIKKQDEKNKAPSLKKKHLPLKRVEYFFLPRFIEEQHKYFIRGEIVIDVNMIKQYKSNFSFNSTEKEFRPPTFVYHLKNVKFFTVDFGRSQKPIKEFTFLIEMLDSLNDQQIHQIAMQLRRLQAVFKLIDEKLRIMENQQNQKQITSNLKQQFLSYFGQETSQGNHSKCLAAGDVEVLNIAYKKLVGEKNKFFDISFDETQSYYRSCSEKTDSQNRLDSPQNQQEIQNNPEEQYSAAEEKYHTQGSGLFEHKNIGNTEQQQKQNSPCQPLGKPWQEVSTWDKLQIAKLYGHNAENIKKRKPPTLNEDQSDWNFQHSISKAHRLLSEIYKKKQFIMYYILRGSKEQYELASRGINQDGLKLMLNNENEEEISKILLENGRLLMENNLIDEIENKIKIHQFFFSQENPNSNGDEFVTFKKKVNQMSIKGVRLEVEVKVERYRLSNYKNSLNDYLVLGFLQNDKYLNLLNQASQMLPTEKLYDIDNEFLQNIAYQAKSEFLIEKFFCNGNNKLARFLQKRKQKLLAKKVVQQAGYRLIDLPD